MINHLCKKIVSSFSFQQINAIIKTKKKVINMPTVKDGVIGHAIGDAMGVPVEFKDRETLTYNPVTEMIGHGTYNVPKGFTIASKPPLSILFPTSSAKHEPTSSTFAPASIFHSETGMSMCVISSIFATKILQKNEKTPFFPPNPLIIPTILLTLQRKSAHSTFRRTTHISSKYTYNYGKESSFDDSRRMGNRRQKQG